MRTSADGEELRILERAAGTRTPKTVAQLTSGVSGEHSAAKRVHCTPGLAGGRVAGSEPDLEMSVWCESETQALLRLERSGDKDHSHDAELRDD